MGKKKAVDAKNPDSLKEAGNKAFGQRNFEEAVKMYTMAIELAQESPNHIYFANRANAYLEMGQFEDCIADCNQAMTIDPVFPKSYYRKAKAQVNLQKLSDALETLKQGLENAPENHEATTLMAQYSEEIKKVIELPDDSLEKRRFLGLLKEEFKIEKTWKVADGGMPEDGDVIQAHYTGKLEDGTVFDSSYGRGQPIQFPLGDKRLFLGWNKGFKQMRKGEKAILTCPPDHAYGDKEVPGKIPANSTVIFEVELVDFKKMEDCVHPGGG